MALVSSCEMLKKAQGLGTAIGAFNIENMEMAQAVVEAANEAGLPIILQTTSSTLKYATPATFAGIAAALARDSKIDIAMHLDHGNSYELAMQCIKDGYTSVMFDGSTLSLEENIRISAQVVQAAGSVPVEAELGSVGGKEDDHEAENNYTDPDDALRFVRETGIASLAIAIGTAHGIYSGTPVLDIERLKAIRQRVDIPLVLHGASGVPADAVRTCIKEGICKVNFATELRIAYSDGVKEYLRENPKAYDPKAYGKAGRAFVKKCVHEKFEMLQGA
ncbi:MAG: ketose-bisphosphate aldolase [Defluviitaleaceae bacterium]|nr:ketose-bisphosphate aldolase [Defluviitaleaceae bacterium]MCL2274368.1 ketose-bisphosphate aldolase [Defluviitaleaceae bacterium]